MAGGSTGAYAAAQAIDVTRAATFIPEIWSNEVLASHKRSLQMASMARVIDLVGEKGDTFNIPVPIRGTASAKAAKTAVTLNYATDLNVAISLNRHYEYSRLIEDIVKTQALSSMRRFYTDDAGYALAREQDQFLLTLARYSNSGAGTNVYANAYIGGDGTTAYVAASNNASAITDAAIRRTIQRLDDNDIPMERRYFVIPPVARNTLMGLARFTEQAYTGERGSGNVIRSGIVGNVYGVDVAVSANCDAGSGTTATKVSFMFHRDTLVLVRQMGVRTQTQYKQEFLASLLTADHLYGGANVRTGALGTNDVPCGGYALIVPA